MSPLRFIVVVACAIICGTQTYTILAMKENDNTRLSIGANEVFSYFIEHKNHLLNVGKLSTFFVGLISECALRCARLALCLSFNIEEASLHRAGILCELLSEGLYNVPHHFKRSEEFHHWSKLVSNRYHQSCRLLCLRCARIRQENYREHFPPKSPFYIYLVYFLSTASNKLGRRFNLLSR